MEVTEAQSEELNREWYFNRLSSIDRDNLEKVADAFHETLSSLERKGALLAVHGSLADPPRLADIDLLVVLENHPEDPKKEPSQTFLAFAIADFRTVFKPVIDNLVKKIDGKVDRSQEPYSDGRENTPLSSPVFDGSIGVKLERGTPFDFIRVGSRRNYRELMKRFREPYIVITKV